MSPPFATRHLKQRILSSQAVAVVASGQRLSPIALTACAKPELLAMAPPKKLLTLTAAPRCELHRPPLRPWSRTTGSAMGFLIPPRFLDAAAGD
jgi:hypothetical protein